MHGPIHGWIGASDETTELCRPAWLRLCLHQCGVHATAQLRFACSTPPGRKTEPLPCSCRVGQGQLLLLLPRRHLWMLRLLMQPTPPDGSPWI